MKVPFLSLERLAKAAVVATAAFTVVAMVAYSAILPDRVRQASDEQTASARLASIEATIAQVVAQLNASGRSNQLTFEQIIAALAQLSAAANAREPAGSGDSAQVQALAARQLQLETAMQQVVTQVTASGQSNQANFEQLRATAQQLAAALSALGSGDSVPTQALAARQLQLETALQQVVAQVTASGQSNQTNFEQLRATAQQLTAALSVLGSGDSAQTQALAARQLQFETALQQVVAQVTASGQSTQTNFEQFGATVQQLAAALSALSSNTEGNTQQLKAALEQLKTQLLANQKVASESRQTIVNGPAPPPVAVEVGVLPVASRPVPAVPVFRGLACTVPTSAPPGQRPSLPALAPAAMRILPYPFRRYFTIASDADSMTFEAAQSIKSMLAGDLRLNISDSAFIDPFYMGLKPGRPIVTPDQSQVSVTDAGAIGLHEFVNFANGGYVDTIHGWGNAIFLAAEQTRFNLAAEAVGAPVRQATQLKSLNVQPLIFGRTVPTDLIFWYTMPLGGRIVIELRDESDNVVWSVTPDLAARPIPTPVSIPLNRVPLSFYQTPEPRLSVSFIGPVAKASAIVENLALSTSLRDGAISMRPVFDRLNIRLPIFTTHTFPPAGLFGLENVSLPDRAAWSARFLGDNPESPSYWIDVLDDLGVEFFLTANRTSVIDKAWDVRELTYPFLFHDGKYRYSFNRIYHNLPGGLGAAASLEVSLGAQIRSALSAGDKAREGNGSVLYTHWGYPQAKEQFDKVGGKWPLSQPSLDALREVAARYYGIRDGKVLPVEDRIWVAPLHRVLVYSQTRRQAESRVTYSKAGNAVVVSRWNDQVTGRLVPGCDQPLKRLGGITVYVDDSSTARAFIDDVEVASFTRNPPDETGRQSITFVDPSTPTLVFDEVDLLQLQGKVIPKSARYFLNKAQGYQSKRSIEIVAGPGDGPIKGEVEWRPAVLDASRSDAIQFAYKKSNPASSVGIVFEMANGDAVEVHEKALTRRAKGAHAEVADARDGEWHLVTIDHALLDHLAAGKISAPSGKVDAVRFVIDGNSGDRVFFDRVAFLRQNPMDAPESGFVVGGRIDFGDLPKQPVRVIMERKGGQFAETRSDADGIYYFDAKVARSEIVMIYAIGGVNQDKFFPDVGRMIQVERNMADLDIRMGKDMRGPDLQASVVKEEKGVSSMVPGIGRIYKPHSQYITSGLSTPPEFRIEHAINNLGYIDRERRPENPSGALRVLLMGVCTTFGHTEEMFHHAAMVLEGMLELRTGRDVEVINMSSALQQSGYSFGYFDKLVRDYKIDVVAIELIGPLEVGMTKPEFAAMYHMNEPGHFPQMAYSEGPDGKLLFEPADASFFLHPLADPAKKAAREADLKKNAYVIDGVDFLYLFHRDLGANYSDKDKSVFPYYSKLLKRLRSDFEAAGVKPVFVVNDLFGAGGVAPEAWGNKIARGNFDKRMRDYCAEVGAPCLLFTEQMIKRYPDISQRHWRRDSHYGRVGYRWFAESIADYLVASDFAKKPMQFWPAQLN